MEFFIDRLNRDYVEGWALASGGISHIEVFVDEESVGVTHTYLPRPDVSLAKPDIPAAVTTRSGFLFAFSQKDFKRTEGNVRLKIVPRDGPPVETGVIPVANIEHKTLAEGKFRSDRLNNPAPFPGSVMAALCALRGGDNYDRPWTDELVEEALGDIEFLVRRGSRFLPGFGPYLIYLKGLWAKFVLTRDHFPKLAKPGSTRQPNWEPSHSDRVGQSREVALRLEKDAIATGTSIEEVITIAHHLFVLREHRVEGRLAEFGCFKGFSTALLSNACFELDIEMDVFDSFAGLPPSESSYYKEGEFMGTLEEVKRNVAEFGRLNRVNFHPGFFSDTLSQIEISPMCIWMDVDLASSSRDVMGVLERLPRKSCLFSHECTERHFHGGAIQQGSGADEVVPPIVEAFRRAGRNITGRYLCGYTGAFWDKDVSWPVLPTSAVLRLIHMD